MNRGQQSESSKPAVLVTVVGGVAETTEIGDVAVYDWDWDEWRELDDESRRDWLDDLQEWPAEFRAVIEGGLR